MASRFFFTKRFFMYTLTPFKNEIPIRKLNIESEKNITNFAGERMIMGSMKRERKKKHPAMKMAIAA